MYCFKILVVLVDVIVYAPPASHGRRILNYYTPESNRYLFPLFAFKFLLLMITYDYLINTRAPTFHIQPLHYPGRVLEF